LTKTGNFQPKGCISEVYFGYNTILEGYPNPAFEKIEYFIRYQKSKQISIIKRKGDEKI